MTVTDAASTSPFFKWQLIVVGLLSFVALIGTIILAAIGRAVPSELTAIDAGSFAWFTGSIVTAGQFKGS